MSNAISLSLSKGENMSLSKAAPGLKKIRVGLSWDARQTSGDDFDLDASALRLTAQGKVRGTQDFVFYNQLTTTDGSVKHSGDERTGASEGDDETITVDLTLVPTEIQSIIFPVTIHEAKTRRQNFGMVRNASIKIYDDSTGQELARYDLTEDGSTLDSMIFGEVYRHNGDWKFRAVGQGSTEGLGGICRAHGLDIR